MLALTAAYTGQRYVQTQTGTLWAILMMLSELMLTMLRLTASLAALTEAGGLKLMPSFIPYRPIWASSSPEGKDSFDTRDEE